MTRRLYFLFPDQAHAQRVVDELVQAGVPETRMHALARPGIALDGLPGATRRQREDAGGRLERRLWEGNLGLFALALLALLASLGIGEGTWAVLCLAVMAVSFLAGLLFTHLPNAHLDQFQAALGHGEILLLVDVPKSRVRHVEDLIQWHHPEAAVGGVGWTIAALGL